VSSALYKRSTVRAAAGGGLQRRVGKLGARRAAFNTQLPAVYTGSVLSVSPTAAQLTRLSALHRRNRVRQLGQKSAFDKLRVRSSKFSIPVSRPLQFAQSLATQREQVADSIPTRLVAAVNNFAPVTPL
jgi:hypothetical protein